MVSSQHGQRDARNFALSLPEAEELAHYGIPSFRVRGKIFATQPDEDHLRVMAGEAEIRAAVAEDPASCAEFYWGRRLACVVVDLRTVNPDLLQNLLMTAWSCKAPKSLVEQLAGLSPPATPAAQHLGPRQPAR